MDRVLICQGKKAEKPYRFLEFELNIYTIEELCYCLRKNLHMLDESIMREQLCQFVETELALPNLAMKLRKTIENREGLSGFVSAIMRETGYVTEEQLQQLATSLREVEGKSSLLRRKARADFCLENKWYQKALSEYHAILREETFEKEADKADIYHNIGTVYARLFFFKEAAKEYAKAYGLEENKESLRCYLQALHMYLPREEYIKRVTEEMIPEEDALMTEKTLAEILPQVQECEKQKRIQQVQEYRRKGEIPQYYEALDQCFEEYKQEYRNGMERTK